MARDTSEYIIRFGQVVVGTAFLLLGMLAVRQMLYGSIQNLWVMIGLTLLVAVVLLFDRHYWLLAPLGLWSNGLVEIPFFDLSELGCLLVVGVFLVRTALKRDKGRYFQIVSLLALPYFAWVLVGFMLNPSGIYLFGGQKIGARFYLKILIGFCTLLVMSMQSLDEKDCRRLFFAAITVASIALIKGFVLRATDPIYDEGVSAYELLPAVVLCYWLLTRYRLQTLLQVSWKTVALGLLGVIALYTGKRRAAGNLALFPLVRALVARQDRFLAIGITTLAFLMIIFLVIGQGHLYDLPLPMQRGLSVLPGKWDRRIESGSGGKDLFREIVHDYAWQEVKRSPWVGREGFAIDLEEIRWMTSLAASHNYEGHAVAGNWHSTWLGMWADFGIPAVLGWAVFSFGSLWVALKRLSRLKPGSYRHTFVLYYAMTIILMLVASRTSGHSALQPFQLWPLFGLMLAVNVGGESETKDAMV